MKISKPITLIKNDLIEIQVSVHSLQGSRILWYRLENKFSDLLTDFSDAFLVALLLPAMARGEDIYIEGKISEKLFYNFSGRLQVLLKQVIPSLTLIKIYPVDVMCNDKKGEGVATGFSGGIDSFCVLADHFYSTVTAGFKITHLLYHNVGSHGWGREQLFNKRYNHLKPLTERLGLPFISINSNLESFYGGKDEIQFVNTYNIRNISNPLLLQGGIKYFLYASAVSYKSISVIPNGRLGHIDPILLPLLSTEVFDAFSVGCEYTRVEKTIRVNDTQDSYDILDVCVDSNPGKPWNCAKCFKCLRTLLTFEILGAIENYSESFNLNIYYQYRNDYIKEILQSDDIFSKEIIRLAKERNYKLM